MWTRRCQMSTNLERGKWIGVKKREADHQAVEHLFAVSKISFGS